MTGEALLDQLGALPVYTPDGSHLPGAFADYT